MASASSCPDVELLTGYLCRQIPEAERGDMELHVERCGDCRAILAEAARALGAGADPSSAPTRPRESGASAGAERVPPPPVPRDGVVPARYRLRALLGMGGMGIVYRAHDMLLDREVALKLVRPREEDEPSPQEAERLLHEARAVARVRHPNLITVYDAGELQGRVFMAMELVEGGTLRAFARGRSPAEILAAYLQAGAGLHAAHEAGIVHGDFKPDNVLCGGGRVVVTDFGLARARGSPGGASPGRGGGTPPYMAPELLAGAEPTERSDQYALCRALRDALGARGAGGPRGPLRGLGPILARGLSADAEERYPSVQALCAALERCLPQRRSARIRGAALGGMLLIVPVLAVSGRWPSRVDRCRQVPTAMDQIWSPAQRGAIEQRVAALMGTRAREVLPRLLAGLDEHAARWREAQAAACEAPAPAPAPAERRARCLREGAERLRHLRDQLLVADPPLIERAPILLSHLRSPTACLKGPQGPAVADERFDVLGQRLAALELLATRGRHWEGVDEAREVVLEAEALAEPALLSRALRTLATMLAESGGRAEAEPILRRSIALAGAAFDGDQEVMGLSYLMRVLAEEPKRLEEAWQLGQRAELLMEQLGREGERSKLLEYTAIVASKLGRYDEAAERLARALALAERQSDPLDVATLLNLLANTRLEQQRPREAVPLLDRALEIRLRILGPSHTRVAGAMSSLCRAYAMLGRGAEAVALGERALAIRQEALGADHLSVGQVLMSLSEAYHAAGRTADAVRAARRALHIRQAARDEYLVIESQGVLAGRLRAAGALPEARAEAEDALRRADTLLPAAHPIRRMVAAELAAVQSAEGGVPDGGPREGGS